MTDRTKITPFLSLCPAEWDDGKITIVFSEFLQNHHVAPFSCDAPVLVILDSGSSLKSIYGILCASYVPEFRLRIKIQENDELLQIMFKELAEYENVEALFLPAIDQVGSAEAFQEIVAHLRATDGCPWDREQTHESLRPFLLEESYEMLDALDNGDMQGVMEELGDVLLQIYLHAQIASERGEFSMRDIIASAARKMIRRHPHVFSDVDVNGDVGQVLRNWQDIKEAERRSNNEPETKGILDGVPNSMSALLLAQTYQGRAAAVGFDWDDIEGVLAKVEEEVVEIRQADTPDDRVGEVGDLFFALVNLARWLGMDAESALRGTNLKFAQRFAYVEMKAREKGRSLNEMSLEDMDQFWDEAKSLGI